MVVHPPYQTITMSASPMTQPLCHVMSGVISADFIAPVLPPIDLRHDVACTPTTAVVHANKANRHDMLRWPDMVTTVLGNACYSGAVLLACPKDH